MVQAGRTHGGWGWALLGLGLLGLRRRRALR
jgi:MYXO-CTERM domain-containing protein